MNLELMLPALSIWCWCSGRFLNRPVGRRVTYGNFTSATAACRRPGAAP